MSAEQPIPILDDQERVQTVDKRDMLRLINELPEQCETALGVGRGFAVEPLTEKPNVIFISGVGDSGLAGDMVVATVGEEASVPIVSDHGGRLPAYVGEGSVVFIVDYSGKSQSALRNYREAVSRRANVICVTTGGRLREAASNDDGRIVKIPSGQPSRTAIGYLYAPIVAVIEGLGLVSGAVEKLSYAIRLLKNSREYFRFTAPTSRNLAKQLALALMGKTPVIYGAAGYRAAIARRWKSQIGANSKSPACVGLFPNLADGEISAWEASDRAYPPVAMLFFTDAADKMTEIRDVMGVSRELLERFGVTDIEMQGNTTYEKLLYGVYLGDYVSCYLAIAYGVNPSITENAAAIAERVEPPPPPPPPPAPEAEVEAEEGTE
jgi:glucose/mannose-6-phosphate isomerase